MEAIGQILLGLACFLFVCWLLDRTGPRIVLSKQPKLQPPDVYKTEKLRPWPEESDEEGPSISYAELLKILSGVKYGPSERIFKKVIDNPTKPIEESYPKRLNNLRDDEGFRSSSFENLWRITNGR